jgi:hypothetical protein
MAGDVKRVRGDSFRWRRVGDANQHRQLALVQKGNLVGDLHATEFLEFQPPRFKSGEKCLHQPSVLIKPEAARRYRVQFTFRAFISGEHPEVIGLCPSMV